MGRNASALAAAGVNAPQPVNVLISNVPGPRQTRYFAGAEMLTHYPVSVPAHGLGVNITVQSYRDMLYVGITACRHTLPDASVLRDDLVQDWQSLREITTPVVERINPIELEDRAAA